MSPPPNAPPSVGKGLILPSSHACHSSHPAAPLTATPQMHKFHVEKAKAGGAGRGGLLNNSWMGALNCCAAGSEGWVRTIPDPSGDPIDPLTAQGDLIEAISWDPHINYFKNQMEGVMMAAGREGRRVRRREELAFATTDKKEYESYIEMINSSIGGNELATTNVLSFLFKEVADMREREEVEAKFKNEKYAALKCFVYLYTGSYAYKKVNHSLRANEHQRLAPIVALVKKELTMFSQENSSLANRNIGLLFRGIDTPDPLMVEKSRMYWKGFTSTALNREVTKQFGRYQYTIALKRGLSHDYLIIPKELSHFEEEEVLIFPYFYFEVARVQAFKANKTENYDIIQMPPETDPESLEKAPEGQPNSAHQQ